MDGKEMFKNCSSFFLSCFRDAMDCHCKEEIALAVARQKEQDVCCTIASFLDLKVSDSEIMRLLSKFYDMDSIEETIELIKIVKVENQFRALRDYLNELGMSRIEVAHYLKDHGVRMNIREDSKLQNMPIDKLKAYFDKH